MSEAMNNIPDLSGIMDIISKNPALIETAKSLLSSMPKTAEPTSVSDKTDESPAEASDKKEDEVSVAASAIPKDLQKLLPSLLSGKEQSRAQSNRCALLRALRPYMSPQRCEAIDKLLTLGQLGDLLGGIDLKR